ncbi:hypothetical protein ACQQR6_004165 [Providencia stuartii]
MDQGLYGFRQFGYVIDNFSSVFLYHHWLVLFVIWAFFVLMVSIIVRSLNHVIFIGMSDDDREDSRNVEVNGKRQKRGVFASMQYDKPYFSLLLLRQAGFFIKILLIFIIAFMTAFFIVTLISAFFDIDYVITPYKAQYYLLTKTNMYGLSIILVGSLVGYIVSAFLYHSFIKPFFGEIDLIFNEEAISRRESSKMRDDKLTDIRNFNFKDSINYNPVDYFYEAKSKKSIFLGIDENNKPILIPKLKWDETNIQVIGKMGSGKGVLSTVALVQCVELYNDINIIFDPKNDEWAYHVFKHFFKDDLLYIDLNRGQLPQVNPFKGANSDEINELLVASFGLGEKGTDADFYKTGDRKVCRDLSQNFTQGTDLRGLLSIALNENFRKSYDRTGENFFNLLEELGQLDSISAHDGIDLVDILNNQNKKIIYITGSLRDEVVVKAQKMLFLRMVQILEKRNRNKDVTHVNIMLDEIKYLISKSALEAMGTLRDKKANILFTHQSRGDLEVSTKEIDGQTARKVIEDSAGLRWIYRTDNYESAKWASDFTAGGLVDVERRNLSVNQSNVEMASKEATIFKQKANYIDISVIQNLPSRCGLIVGDGQLARLAYSSPILVEKSDKCVTSFETQAISSREFLASIRETNDKPKTASDKKVKNNRNTKPVDNPQSGTMVNRERVNSAVDADRVDSVMAELTMPDDNHGDNYHEHS